MFSLNDGYLYRLLPDDDFLQEEILLTEDEHTMIHSIFWKNNLLVAVPKGEEYIVKYDIVSKKRTVVPLNGCNNEFSSNTYRTGCVKENYLYLFGYKEATIIRIELSTGKSELLEDYREEIKTDPKNLDGNMSFMIDLMNEAYILFLNVNKILHFDFRNNRKELITIDGVDLYSGFHCGELYRDELWLIPRDTMKNGIVRWNRITGKTVIFDKYPEKLIRSYMCFFTSARIGNTIYVFSHCGNTNIAIDADSGEMKLFQDLYDTSKIEVWKYKVVCNRKGKLFYVRDGIWGNYDVITGENEKHYFKPEEKIINRYRHYNFEALRGRKDIVYENKELNLELFLEVVRCTD